MQIDKKKSQIHIALVYKNFAAHQGISHIGLGVAALNNAKVLQKHGIRTSIWPTNTVQQLRDRLQATPDLTHCIISAAWLPTVDLARLSLDFPMVELVVNIHSNVGFLQADPNGVKLIGQNIDLEQSLMNFRVSGNSKKFVRWVREAKQAPALYLPNMYYLDYSQRHARHPWHEGDKLRMGAFGAVRSQKNIMTAAGAALELSHLTKSDVEFWISGGRNDGPEAKTLLRAVGEMFANTPGVTLKELSWKSWPEFRDNLRNMNILFQVSYTESFNMVTADGIAEGVPSVTSEAIDWVPSSWHAHFDDADDVARKARHLLLDRHAPAEGLRKLEEHNRESFRAWMTALHIIDSKGYTPIQKDPFFL